MTPAQKAKRRAYTKARRHRIMAAARAAGIIGAPRPKLSDSERISRRKEYRKKYFRRVCAEAKAYRELMKKDKS